MSTIRRLLWITFNKRGKQMNCSQHWALELKLQALWGVIIVCGPRILLLSSINIADPAELWKCSYDLTFLQKDAETKSPKYSLDKGLDKTQCLYCSLKETLRHTGVFHILKVVKCRYWNEWAEQLKIPSSRSDLKFHHQQKMTLVLPK